MTQPQLSGAANLYTSGATTAGVIGDQGEVQACGRVQLIPTLPFPASSLPCSRSVSKGRGGTRAVASDAHGDMAIGDGSVVAPAGRIAPLTLLTQEGKYINADACRCPPSMATIKPLP